jgi:uncharacterized RDD family membrane protein YckC
MNKTSTYLLSSLAGLLLFSAPRHVAADEAAAAPTAVEAPAAVTPPAAPAASAPAAPTTDAKVRDKVQAKVRALTEKIEDKLHKNITITATAKTSNEGADKADDAEAAADDADMSSHHHDNAIVSIGHDSHLPADGHADAVVSVLGSSTSEGVVDDAVVSVLGNTRVTGPVGDSAVAVLGNTYVDSAVKGEVVAVLGDVELGPHAVVDGGISVVGGTLKRDPAAIVRGDVNNVVIFGPGGHLEWLHQWAQHCLYYGRPLALAPGLGWAWGVALCFLGLYLLFALMFPKAIDQCARTMEEQPGRSVIAAILSVFATPIAFVLLVVTVIGIALVPFLAMGLFLAVLFGKAVALAWIGRRVLAIGGEGRQHPPVLAVLIGGIVVLALYLVPILGFVVYKGLDILGLGIVVYTLINSSRGASDAAAKHRAAALAGGAATGGAAGAGAAAASAAAATAHDGSTAAPDAAAAPAAPAAAAAVPVADASMERAGFWIRMAALLLDIILIAIVGSLLPFSHGDSHHVSLLLLAIYGAVMWKYKGTTIGGVICHLRVVRLDGRAVDWPTAAARALGCFLSLAVAGLGFLWVVFDPERQSWHDKIAGTVVVRVPKGTPLI